MTAIACCLAILGVFVAVIVRRYYRNARPSIGSASDYCARWDDEVPR